MPVTTSVRVLLADRAGPARRALGALLRGLDGVTLAGEVSSREEIGAAVRRLRADVVVIDDRLVAGEGQLLAGTAVRAIVVGVDDAPAYAARASALGAEAWLLKDRAGEDLPLLLA